MQTNAHHFTYKQWFKFHSSTNHRQWPALANVMGNIPPWQLETSAVANTTWAQMVDESGHWLSVLVVWNGNMDDSSLEQISH